MSLLRNVSSCFARNIFVNGTELKMSEAYGLSKAHIYKLLKRMICIFFINALFTFSRILFCLVPNN